MRVLQEDTVRQLFLKQGKTEIHVGPNTYVTQQAKDYIKDKRLKLVVDGTLPENQDIRPAPEMAAGRFQTEDGRRLDHKPEHMTHLYGNVLVPKNHPRIILRGKLDSLEAELVRLQASARERENAGLSDSLAPCLEFCRTLMGCEVSGKPLPEWNIFGFTPAELRERSQNPQKYFGIGHLMPDVSMGIWCAELNRLRTLSREVELAAVTAFVQPDGSAQREDLLQGYNRLSSAFYLLMLQTASAERKKGEQTDE